MSWNQATKLCASRVFFLSLLSRNFDDQLSSNFHRFLYFIHMLRYTKQEDWSLTIPSVQCLECTFIYWSFDTCTINLWNKTRESKMSNIRSWCSEMLTMWHVGWSTYPSLMVVCLEPTSQSLVILSMEVVHTLESSGENLQLVIELPWCSTIKA